MGDFPWLLAGVFVAICVLQAEYLRWSRRARRSISEDGFGEIELGLVLNDVQLRAGRGQSPDWIAYFDRFDRLLEPALDRIRQLAGSALATGVGGTMLLFAIELLFERGQLDPSNLHWPALIAIASSVVGILVHLFVVLRVLETAQKQADGKIRSLQHSVQEKSSECMPETVFGKPFRQEMAHAIGDALGSVPMVMEEIKESARQLWEMTAQQIRGIVDTSQELTSGIQELSSAAQQLTKSGHHIGESAKSIDQSVCVVGKLPGQLEASMEKASEFWRTQMESAMEGFIRAIREALSEQRLLLGQMQDRFKEHEAVVNSALTDYGERQEKIAEAFKENTGAVEALPGKLRGAYNDMSEDFGTEAQKHLLALKDALNVVGKLPSQLEASMEKASEIWNTQMESAQSGFTKAIGGTLSEQQSLLGQMRDRFEAEAARANEVLKVNGEQQQKIVEVFEQNSAVVEALPDHLRSAYSELSKGFITEVRNQALALEHALKTLAADTLRASRERQQKVVVALEQTSMAVESLPTALATTNQTLSEEFGKEARIHVLELRDSLKETVEKLESALKKSHEAMRQQFLTRHLHVVGEMFKELGKEIDSSIRRPLAVVGDQLKLAADVMPDAATRFSDGINASSEALASLPERLDSTTRLVDELAEGVHNAIETSFDKAFEPVAEDTRQFYEYARSAHEQIGETVQHLIDFITELINRVEHGER